MREAAKVKTLPTSTANITAHSIRPTACSLMIAVSAGEHRNFMRRV
jgi:hypothetical protein